MTPKHVRQRQRDEGVVTLGTIAKALGISRTAAYVRARAGELPMRWRGGRFEMTRDAFDSLLAEHAAAKAGA